MSGYELASEVGVEVKVEPTALADIFLAIHINPVEVSGLGKVRCSGNLYTIEKEIIVLKQTVSDAHTEFDDEMRGHWLHEMVASGRGEEINEFRLWWHSHVDMGTSFSPRDRDTIENKLFDQDLRIRTHEYWISLVGNKYGQFTMRLDVYKPERLPTIYVDNARFAPEITKEEFRALMLARQDRMTDIMRANVIFGDKGKKPFEKILEGVFGE